VRVLDAAGQLPAATVRVVDVDEPKQSEALGLERMRVLWKESRERRHRLRERRAARERRRQRDDAPPGDVAERRALLDDDGPLE